MKLLLMPPWYHQALLTLFFFVIHLLHPLIVPSRQDKNVYSQINHKLQWHRQKNTTQHIHDKQITDIQIHIHYNRNS
jgi:hypothetical protein